MGQIDSVVTKIEQKALVSLFFTNENLSRTRCVKDGVEYNVYITYTF